MLDEYCGKLSQREILTPQTVNWDPTLNTLQSPRFTLRFIYRLLEHYVIHTHLTKNVSPEKQILQITYLSYLIL